MGVAKIKQDTGYAWFVAIVLSLCSACSIMGRPVLLLLMHPVEKSLGRIDTSIGLLLLVIKENDGMSIGAAILLRGLQPFRLAASPLTQSIRDVSTIFLDSAKATI